jgi:2,4-dienoyl-CoA reductase-like NADH-dependent reductase (Old Yellow Enzyme family)
VDLFLEDQAWGRPQGVQIFLEAMRSINTDLKEAGAKTGIQLWHGNQVPPGDGASPLPGAETAGPSAQEDRRALTREEIHFIIQKFGSSAAAAKEAGFDFVEVHGAHGFLPCQFFSGADNLRVDEYGGDLNKRMRFGLELVDCIRREVGKDFPIFYRIGAEENRPGGITITQSRRFAMELEKVGVDCFDVSIGWTGGRSASPSRRARMGSFVPQAQAIKKGVSVPVMAVGRINLPQVAESILREGKADLIGIARQLVADPFWPKKVAEGREAEITPCLSCNACFQPMRRGKWNPLEPICAVNKRAGRESEV